MKPGDIVGGFRITRLVAAGAMGEIYLALDEELGRRVALKFVKTTSLELKALDRFREEAQITARFNHPHIVTVYAAGAFEGRPWLALEYLDGETLRERLDRGPLTVPEALRIAHAIADALAEAHRHEVIHADLKPENVLLPRDGRVRVVDFGLARLVGTEATAASGTPAYMAPERWNAGPPRASMDVWALGVLLHEAIEGKRPLTEQELVHLAYAPRELSMGARVQSASCSSLVSECLRIDPTERPSATDVMSRIDRLLAGRDEVEGRSPFRGLEAFTELDAPDFHGRAEEIDAALERLRTDALVPIVGPSGVGKSSFVFAGVVPRLREVGGWEILSLRPGRKPWASLASALQCDVTALTSKPAGLVTELRRRSAGRLLLFIDQFEELVTLGDDDDRLSFLRALALAASADEPWRVMVTVRSDFLGQFAAVPELTSALQSVLVLRPLGRAALEAAVLGPLARVGHAPDEPTLPAQIAAELMGQPAALPLLQFVCQALWDRRDAQRKVVLRREYDAMGGAVGALATHAERLVSELLPGERKLTRALMIRLVNPDGTRKPRTRDELLQGLAPEAAASLDRLLSQRLLVTTRHEDTGEPLLELAHESLVSTWPQLTRWLAETQESRTLLQEIEQAALFWDKRGRRDDETWVNEALLDVTRRVQKWNVSLTSTPRDFIEAGKARQARMLRRRRLIVIAAFTTISLFALSASAAAYEFREKERIAIAQQELIRLAAGDVGRFELVLEPFHWDSTKLEPTPVSAAELPELNWRIHAASRTSPPVRGKELEASRVMRSQRHVDGQGHLSEMVEVGRDPVFIEFVGRGDDCGSSWLYVQTLPGYSERQTPPAAIHIPVASCKASREGIIRFSMPDGSTFGLARAEVTGEQWSTYAAVQSLTGDQRNMLPSAFAQHGRSGLPLVGVNAFTAERVCRFFGQRLPTVAEWMRATRAHPQRTGREANRCVANLEGDADGFDLLAPVGNCPGDVTEEGVVDLLGNVSEWTSDDESEDGEGGRREPGYGGLRNFVGSNWSFPADAPPGKLDYVNSSPATFTSYAHGVRCASD
ncbi:MAG: bifunctional serine/threonine-protein kinase/formylglycine-generating enzyme family protein [Archangium sp.]|nr:bifunctional serine/threonine-protein kinase/formylglycine-generating enzyme family protein [Archangium sp.]